MHVSEVELEEFIIDSGLVSKKEVHAAALDAAERGQPLGDTLVSRGSISEDALRRVQAYVLGIPFINLKTNKIPFEVLSLIPEPIARTHNSIAFKKKDDSIEIAMLDIEDFAFIESVGKKTGLKIFVRLTDTDSIKHSLLQYQKYLKDEFGDIISAEAKKIRAPKGNKDVSEKDLRKIAEDLSIVRIVDTLLKHALVQDASDIHIEPMEGQVLVRYRIDGILHDAMTLPKATATGITARIKALSNLKLAEKQLPQDGRFKMETEADRVSFRVSIIPTFFGEKAVLRVLHETGNGFTLESLGFHGESLERIHHSLKQQSGLILVSGPASSGKTTTLYTMLDILNQPDKNISTIEDPIEYQMTRINQTQVNLPLGLTYAAGLRALLRQDPDIVLIGEISDSETASLAVTAALTGRLVLATITAESPAEAITRLTDMGIEPFLLASALQAVIGQRVVRRLCDSKSPYAIADIRKKMASEADFEAAFKALQDEKMLEGNATIDDLTFYHPVPTTECRDGYKTRIGINEVLVISPAIRELMLRTSTNDDIETQAKKEGMLSIIQDGLYKAAVGATSFEEILRVVAE
ncbi:MAG: GspE/PulE family protein [Candidatus Paceibacteria bacterium]